MNRNPQVNLEMETKAYRELCCYLEHAADTALLSDYTALLIFRLHSPQRREDALDLLRSQLYSRKLSGGRVESWFIDCEERIRKDMPGFVQAAEEQFLRAGLDAEAAQMEAEKARKRKAAPRILPASAFAPEQAAYLLRPYLPKGMLSILGGVSAAGKTSLALDIASAVSAGRTLPFDGESPAEGEAKPRTVFYLTAENDPNKVLRPRCEAMGADLDHLYFQNGANLSMSDPELFTLCRAYRPALLVFDPIQSFLGPGVQMNRAEQVRPLMDRLIALAKELDMAVLLISHMSKPGPGVSSALDRLLGSSDFRNSARSILIAGADPDGGGKRVFAHAKNSLGLPGESQRYHIEPEGTVAYDGPCDLTADRLLMASADTPRTRQPATLNDAAEALDKLLGFVGWVDTAQIYRMGAQRNFSERTLRRAKDILQLHILRVGKPPNQSTYWYRCELSEDAVKADILNQNEQLPLPSLAG